MAQHAGQEAKYLRVGSLQVNDCSLGKMDLSMGWSAWHGNQGRPLPKPNLIILDSSFRLIEGWCTMIHNVHQQRSCNMPKAVSLQSRQNPCVIHASTPQRNSQVHNTRPHQLVIAPCCWNWRWCTVCLTFPMRSHMTFQWGTNVWTGYVYSTTLTMCMHRELLTIKSDVKSCSIFSFVDPS